MTDVTQTPPRRHGLLFSRRRRHEAPELNNTSSPPTGAGCCFYFPSRRQKTAGKSVRFAAKRSGTRVEGRKPTDFSSRGLSSQQSTPKMQRKRSISAKGLRLRDKSQGGSVRRSTSRRSFYSAVSSASKWEGDRLLLEGEADSNLTTAVPSDDEEEPVMTCLCKFPAHVSFDPLCPIITAPGTEPGSYAELLHHAKSILGNWVTVLERSDSLDPQMIYVGIGKMKRMVMNRLAIPFTAVLEDNDKLLHCWISTPAGPKHTRSSLVGGTTEDKDSDLGDWTAETSMVNYTVKWFCGGMRPVRAMQMKRLNPKFGTAYETRVCLPDPQEGRILLYNISITPPPTSKMPTVHVDRIYKFTSS